MINKSALIKTVLLYVILGAIILFVVLFPTLAQILGCIVIGAMILFLTYEAFDDDDSPSYMDEY